MKIDQLRYFVEIVKCGSLNQAAKNLYISQPALTASIQGLEAELKVPLLRRTNKGVFPTAYGNIVYEDCLHPLNEIAEKSQKWYQFNKTIRETSGVVHICAIAAVCNFMMENLLTGIHQEYPDIEIVLHEASMFQFTQDMLYSNYNIGFTSVYLEDEASVLRQCRNLNLTATPLMQDEYCLYCSNTNPIKNKSILDLSDFSEIELISYSASPSLDIVKNYYHPKRIYGLNSLGNIMQSIAENQGCGVLLRRALSDNWFVKNSVICQVPLTENARRDSVHYLVYAPEEYLTGAEKIVIQYMKKYYAKFYAAE